MTDKIEIRTGVEMPPKARRKSKYEAGHLALAEGPVDEAFEIPLPDEWVPENARLSLAEYAEEMLADLQVTLRAQEQSLFVTKETKKRGQNGTKKSARKGG